MEETLSQVEIEIIKAAEKLFVEKGFSATTMRDISSLAGVNLAMLNYYFRSKDNLFDIIFDEVFLSMVSHLAPALMQHKPIKELVVDFVDAYIEGLKHNSDIPAFIFQELCINPKRLISKIHNNNIIYSRVTEIKEQLIKESKDGVIRHIDDPLDFFINLLALCLFPFLARPILNEVMGLSGEQFSDLIECRRKSVAEFINSALTPLK